MEHSQPHNSVEDDEGVQCTFYPSYVQNDLFDEIYSFMNNPVMWDDSRLTSLDHLPLRDLMVDTVQIVPVSADKLKTLNVFDGINKGSLCLIIPVIGS